MTRFARGLRLFAGLAVASVTTAGAQAHKPERDCATAAKIVARGKPQPKDDWAWSTVLGCGRAASAPVRAAWEATRTRADTLALGALYDRLWSLRDSALFDAAARIFADAAAAPQSRVFSGMLLLSSVSPHSHTSFGTITAATVPGSVCSRGFVVNPPANQGTALPSSARAQVHAMARHFAADRTAPRVVGLAARCIAEHIEIEDDALVKESTTPTPLPAVRVEGQVPPLHTSAEGHWPDSARRAMRDSLRGGRERWRATRPMAYAFAARTTMSMVAIDGGPELEGVMFAVLVRGDTIVGGIRKRAAFDRFTQWQTWSVESVFRMLESTVNNDKAQVAALTLDPTYGFPTAWETDDARNGYSNSFVTDQGSAGRVEWFSSDPKDTACHWWSRWRGRCWITTVAPVTSPSSSR